jgi:hypothetical protein
MGSTLAIKELVIEGKIDASRKVQRPSHENII